MITICSDYNRIVVNKLHVTMKYTFDLVVPNVERQILIRFFVGVLVFKPRYYQSCVELFTYDMIAFE